MPAHYPVPIQEDIRDLLLDLLGRGVAVDKVGKLELEEDDLGAVAEFVTDDGSVGALCVIDGEFAVRAGAALVMVPEPAAEEDLRRGDIDAHLEVAGEVLNVLSRLLNSASTPHLRLAGVHRLPGDLPEGVATLLGAPEFRRDFAVTIEGYGNGRLSLLVA
jgi:hypothetical protein